MKHIVDTSRAARAGLLALGAFAVVSVVGAAPPLAMGFSALRTPGRGLSLPVQGSSGGVSWLGIVVLVAIVAGATAFGVSGWRHSRRTAQSVAWDVSTDGSSDRTAPPEPTVRPSASRPLPSRAPAGVHARRVGGRRDQRL